MSYIIKGGCIEASPARSQSPVLCILPSPACHMIPSAWLVISAVKGWHLNP